MLLTARSEAKIDTGRAGGGILRFGASDGLAGGFSVSSVAISKELLGQSGTVGMDRRFSS